MSRVAVVGSANLDVVATAPRRPNPGETLLGTSYVETPGGKGVNQVIAAAQLTPTAFVARRGSDAAGVQMAAHLEDHGVDIAHLFTADAPTGRAVITVTPDGENSIVVVPGANAALTATDVSAALRQVRPEVALVQLEVADDVVAATANWCAESGARFVLNPSPIRAIPRDTLALADPVVANLAEALALLASCDEGAAELTDPSAVCAELSSFCGSVVVTAGSDGVYFARDGVVGHIEGQLVEVVDTTGAGDAFAGTLAAHIAGGSSLADAAAAGNRVAARLIQFARSDR